MEQINTADRGSVMCLKIGMGEQDYFIPMDKIAGVRMKPEIVRVPEAPEHVAGLSFEMQTLVPYVSLEAGCREKSPSEPYGVLVRNGDGSFLGILCTRVEEETPVAPEVLEEQELPPMARFLGRGEK